MNWPTHSPDLNPIKHKWDNSQRAVFARNTLPTSSEDHTNNDDTRMGQYSAISIRNSHQIYAEPIRVKGTIW